MSMRLFQVTRACFCRRSCLAPSSADDVLRNSEALDTFLCTRGPRPAAGALLLTRVAAAKDYMS